MYVADYDTLKSERTTASPMSSFVIRVSEKELHMFKWIEWIVIRNQPLSMADCLLTHEGMKYTDTCSRIVRQNILALAKR